MRRLSGAALVLLFVVACSRATAPLPAGISIDGPAGIPKSEQPFLGSWHGSWDRTLDTRLVVESITGDRARVIYAWGTTPMFKRGFRPMTGKISGKTLSLDHLPSGPAISFTLRDDGGLDGTYVLEGQTSIAVLYHVAKPT